MTRAEIKFFSTVESKGMLEGVKKILVGFSGGADSSALLSMMNRACADYGIELLAVHINHMIRGEEAFRDERFCENFCRKENIPFLCVRADIPQLAKQKKQGLEECARNFRYSTFESICEKEGIDKIATAHNAGDNLETMIFNIARGCALVGMSGIAPVRDNIIRPLISCTKEEITEYCSENGIEYINDSTNSDIEYTRNYIRHEIIPLIKKINPHAEENAYFACDSLRSVIDFLDRASFECGGIYKAGMHPSLIMRMFAREYSEASGSTGLSRQNFEDFYSLVLSGKTDTFISLPGKLKVCIDKEGHTVFLPDERKKKSIAGDVQKSELYAKYSIKPGINVVPELDCVIVLSEKDEEITYQRENIYNLSIKHTLYFDTINQVDALYVRKRKNGDEYRFGNMTRKVRKLLTTLHLPPSKKADYPVICDSEGILLLPGFPMRDHNNCEKNYKYTIRIFMFEKKTFGG